MVFHASGDVSDIGYAGSSSLLPVPIIMSYSLDDRLLMLDRSLSSVLRETRNAKLVLETIMAQRSDEVKGGLIVYTGDNQGSIDCLQKMKGKGEILDAVRDLYQISCAHDVQLEFVWKPRTSDVIQYVDALSRVVDASDFALGHHDFMRICQKHTPEGTKWGFPTCDVFAGGAKDFHKASKYFTLYYCPRTAGINGLRHPWNGPAMSNSIGRTLLWLFPPFKLIGQVLMKLAHEQVDAILLLPAWTCYWHGMLQRLPIADQVQVDYHKNMFVLGSRLPTDMLSDPPRYRLTAYLIKF